MQEDGKPKTRGFRNLNAKEQRDEVARRLAEQFPVRKFRCRYCRTVVDANTREGHLGRCADAAAAGVTFARGAPPDEHFAEETAP